MQMNHIAAKTPLNHLERLHSPRTFDRADCLRRYLALSGNDRFIPRSTWYQSFALGFGAGLRRSDADPSARVERRSGVLGPGAGGSGRESSLHWHLQLLHPGGRGGNPVLCQDQDGYITIHGSSNPDHIAENFDVFDFELTGQEMNEIRNSELSYLNERINCSFRSFHKSILCY